MLELTSVMILTDLSCDFGGKDEIDLQLRSPPVLALEQPEEQQHKLPSLCVALMEDRLFGLTVCLFDEIGVRQLRPTPPGL